ncbi:MAG TPA: hypothetical protein VGK75_12920 [Casimicrobiaceae bacterium]
MPFPRLSLTRELRRATALVLAAAAFGAAAQDAGERHALERTQIDTAAEERLLALVPERISERDLREVLARAPAPRIINLEGSVPVTMAPFAEFLMAMGYPEERIRDPNGGALSYGSSVDARRLAGTMAWYYEREGMMPMLIGHSQGGMVAIRVLYELAGEFGDSIPVWNPLSGAAEARTTILDPRTGARRPVVGLEVPYVAALATGKLPRILLGQWTMLPRLRNIPDTAEEFTGFSFEWDPIAGNFGSAEPYRAMGSARVRNVILPPKASHLTLPLAKELALDPAARDWINRYVPDPATSYPPSGALADLPNLLHAADIWYSVKKHWCLEAQRLIRSARKGAAAPLQ